MRKYLAFWIIAVAALPVATAVAQNTADQVNPTKSPIPSSLEAEQKQKLLKQLKSPRLEDRMAALHQLVGHDRSLPILKDSQVRAALIDLLQRENQNGRVYETGERTDFQDYYDFLSQAVKKIAVDYGTPEAWKVLVYCDYGVDSPFGQWIAKQPQSYQLMLGRVDDKNFVNRSQALWMLGQICSNQPTLRPKILPLLREKVSSPDDWTKQSAMMGLGICGTAEDITRLQNLPACSNQWNIKLLCRQIEDKISKRLAQPKSQ